MAKLPARRKVLVIEDEPSIRNLLYVLLAGLGCESETAYTDEQGLFKISRESFDAVLLDLRCATLPTDEVVSQIKEVRPNLIGRVLVITSEVSDPQTMETIERLCLPHVPRSRVLQELRALLKPILEMPSSTDSAF